MTMLKRLLSLSLFFLFCIGEQMNLLAQDSVPAQFVECYAPVDYSEYETPFYKSLFKEIKHNPANLSLLPYSKRAELGYQNLFTKDEENVIYNPYEGLQTLNHHIYAEGLVKNKDKSYVWGRAVYERLFNKATLGTDVVDYGRFYPYLVEEKKGGDYHQERYSLSGAYTKPFGKFNLALKGSYTGAVGYRLEDPRPENRVSDYSLALASAYDLGGYSLALGFAYNHYQQEFDVLIRQAGKQELFYSMKGFGLYDYMYSEQGDSYQRYLYADRYELSLSYLPSRETLILDGGLMAQLRLAFDKASGIHSHEREVNVLERGEMNAYLAYILPSEIKLKLSNSTNFSYATGVENQYEQYLVHRKPDIVGYKLLVSNRNHSLMKFNNTFSLHYIYRLAYHFKLFADYRNVYQHFSEHYRKDYYYRSANIGNELSVGTRYLPYTFYGIYASLSFDLGHRKALFTEMQLPTARNQSEVFPINLSKSYFNYLNADYKYLGTSLSLMKKNGAYRLRLETSYRKYFGAISQDYLSSELKLIF